jgi:hypothetical protein
MAAFLFEILVDFFLGLVVDTFVALYRWLRPRRISAEGEQFNAARARCFANPAQTNNAAGLK